jgi:hypothetical protein
MMTTTTIVHWLARLTGLIQIVLGLLFWTGYLRNLIPLHMLIGLIFVLCSWVLAGLAAFAGVHRGLVALTIVWGFVVPILGVTQVQLLPGSAHWVIQVLHLLVGLAAMRLNEELAMRIKGRQPATLGPQQPMSLEDR